MFMKILAFIKFIVTWPFGTIFPWFVTDRVAMTYSEEDGWQVLCREEDLRPEDVYECLGTAKGIAWLGFNNAPSVELDEE